MARTQNSPNPHIRTRAERLRLRFKKSWELETSLGLECCKTRLHFTTLRAFMSRSELVKSPEQDQPHIIATGGSCLTPNKPLL